MANAIVKYSQPFQQSCSNMLTWRVYGLIVVLLFLKMFALVLVQGYNRFKYKTFTNPEDAAYFGKDATVAQDVEIVERAQKTLRNDGENIPIFLFLAAAYIQLGCWENGVLLYFPLFVLSRIVHTLAYLRPTQPLRNRAYLLGIVVMFAVCGHIVWAALRV